MLPKLIGFSGRKKSGKTELAKCCEELGYIIINFADELKKLVCNCLNISPEFLESNKDKPNIYFLNSKIEYISNEIGISTEILQNYVNKQFNSIREILQTLGTDVIRNYNPDWHVLKIKEIIIKNKDTKFCIGDCRFPNEKKMIEDLGGICWYIIRPFNLDYSNHISEISLLWKDFGDNIIINNTNKELLKSRWVNYLNLIYINPHKLNKEYDLFGTYELRSFLITLLNQYNNLFEICAKYNCEYLYIKELYNSFLINISFNKINKNSFLHLDKKNSKYLELINNYGYFKINDQNYQQEGIIIEHNDKKILQEFLNYLNSDEIIYQKFRVNKHNCEKLYYVEFCNPFVIENLKLHINI